MTDPTPPEHTNPLQAEVDRLKQEKAALQEEFATTANDPNLDDTAPLAIKREIVKLVPEALITLRNLLTHAESESTRSKLATYVLSIGLGTVKTPESEQDAINNLIESLRTPTPDTNTNTNT